MPSTTVLVTATTSLIGFLINSSVLFLVLSRGRQKYHFLFSAVLFAIAIWDIGIFLVMVRNNFPEELPIYGTAVFTVCSFLPSFVYSFTLSFLNQQRKKLEMLIWGLCIIGSVTALTFHFSGLFEMGVYNFDWGRIYRPGFEGLIACSIWFAMFYFSTLSSSWFLFRASRKETSYTRKRHIQYIFISMLVISVANSKTFVIYGIESPALIPIGILLTDIFGALIGIAIVKYRLFDITIIIKKATIYSALLALIIFVFSCSEHLLSKYLGDLLGEQPMYIHLISIAIVVGALMPVRTRLERAIGVFFDKKKVEF